tara:strand:- start:36298 stop:36591 length:294 start_codon:yes stop_codon:yes gene_type:complete
MTDDKEFSNFSLERKECEKCGATWINGTHVWRGTGASGNSSELDLAGLVCNKLGNEQCINPMKGQEGGQTWEYRAGYIDGMLAGRTKAMDQLRDQDI